MAKGVAFSIIDHGSEPCKPGRPGEEAALSSCGATVPAFGGPSGKPCLPKWIADTANLLVKIVNVIISSAISRSRFMS